MKLKKPSGELPEGFLLFKRKIYRAEMWLGQPYLLELAQDVNVSANAMIAMIGMT